MLSLLWFLFLINTTILSRLLKTFFASYFITTDPALQCYQGGKMPDFSYFSTESKLISEDDPIISRMERAMEGDNKKQEYTLEKCPGIMDTCLKTHWTIPGFPELSQKLCGKIGQFGGLEVPEIAINQDDCRKLSFDENQKIILIFSK